MEEIYNEMVVIKRSGEKEQVSFDKILNRIRKLTKLENSFTLTSVNYTELAMKVIQQLYDGIKTSELDELAAQQCASLSSVHPHYGILAARIVISNHQKNTNNSILNVVKQLYERKDVHGLQSQIISDEYYKVVVENHQLIEQEIKYVRDYEIDYFGFKTLERAYLLRIDNNIIERPQHMWMRVAIGIHGNDLQRAFETYHLMSQKYFTHATPTLFNAGTPRPQLSSCYLLATEEDSIRGIYDTLTDCALISKWAGGIGLHIHNIRATGTQIRGTNGVSNGIVPMLRVFNNTARYVDQGGGKRNGSFAMYLEPWHADIEDFVEMKKNHGDEEKKARDLFYALWIPDLFMERVKNDDKWTLMCPEKCKGLSDCYGDEFKQLYEKYEKENKGNKSISARKLWFSILDSQIETGTPYMLYKDACNMKSNQKNLGVIKSSNLCTEIIQYSDNTETAVCNLASVGLSKFIKSPCISHDLIVKIYTKSNCNYCKLAKGYLQKHGIQYDEINCDSDVYRKSIYEQLSDKYGDSVKQTMPQMILASMISSRDDIYIGGYENILEILPTTFDFQKLHSVVRVMTRNLNHVIDINFYPTPKTKNSNHKHRPIGLGVQGLADVFASMNISFDSDKAKQLNIDIFKTIYHAALEQSIELAKINGKSYASFEGSPIQNGILQFDKWNINPNEGVYNDPNVEYNWDLIRTNIKKYGLYNSLLVAPMPTASTSQILGNNECFEPFTTNMYVRRTLAGEFAIINKHLLNDMIDIGWWNERNKNLLVKARGSIQDFGDIPKCIRDKYKTVWEISMKSLIDMSRDRGAYVCQSQSLNLWMEDPTYDKLTSMHFYAWKCGLKTGMYYLRSRAKAAPQQFTVDPSLSNECESCSG